MKHIVQFISIALIFLFAGAVTFVSTSEKMPVAPDDANHAQDEAAIRKMVADVQDAWGTRNLPNAASQLPFCRRSGSGFVPLFVALNKWDLVAVHS
jgi:hypothetical protein